MRQKTKQLLCEALVRSETVAKRMARIMSDRDIELLVNGIIVGAAIKDNKLDEVLNKIKSSAVKDLKVTRVTGHGSIVRVHYKVINGDGTEGLEEESKMFDLNYNPECEELFDLQVI